MEKKIERPKQDLTIEQTINRRHFISFATFFVATGAAYGGWGWLYHLPKEKAGITAGTRQPLRRASNKTELFFRKFFSDNHLVETYPKTMAAKKVRVNSDIGINDKGIDPASWKLTVRKNNGAVTKISIDEIKVLPKTEINYDFKCVEGWDQIQHWAGVKFSNFIQHFDFSD